MACFVKFFPERQKQLKDEEIIDAALSSSLKECPELIAKYWGLRRRINREQFKAVDEASIWNKYDLMMEYLRVNGDHQEKFLLSLRQEMTPCQLLQEMFQKV